MLYVCVKTNRVVKMSLAMGDILIKLKKTSMMNKDNVEEKITTQQLEQLYNDRKRKGELPIFALLVQW
jgi:ABC-type cobalamin/Fe3+-siderophores transport system ATPase subunit